MKNAGLLLLQRNREAYARKLHKVLLLASCLTVLILGSYQSKATQVTGTLTVDPSGTASATVFKDLNSVINYLTSATARPDGGPANAAPFGVSGPLLININAGTYYEQVIIPAITGASSTNTITLKGAGTVNTIINCTTATTSLRHTIRLSSTTNIIVRDLTIRNETPGFAWPLHIMGTTSSCVISNCAINFGNTSLSTLVNDNYAGIVMNNNASSISTTGTFANIDIDSNAIYGGNYGVYAAGAVASSTGIRFRYNTCDSANRHGFYFSTVGEVKCLNNKIRNRFVSTGVTDGAGISLQSCSPSVGSGKFHEITNNQIINTESFGLNISNSLTLAAPAKSLIINNAIGGGFRNSNPYGIYISNSSNSNSWNIYNNSVLLDNLASGSTTAAFFASMCCIASDQIDARNNHFVVGNPNSSSIPLYIQNWGYTLWATQFNYNNYYKKGQTNTTTLINLTGTTYNATNITTSGGSPYNLNSISKDPIFVSNTNLSVYTPCNNGVSIPGYTTDITGATRAGTPDIGAYEYTASANDAGITGFVSPAIPFNAGSQNVSVTLSNFGTSPVTSATVAYSVNGGAPVTQVWTGNLAACASTTVTFSGAQALSVVTGTTYSLKAYTSNPNGSTDGNLNNDSSFIAAISTSLSGNYTIDAAGSGPGNFTTFAAAATALVNGGVSGPVTFNVAAGTYNEQVSIPSIPGASATNTITFNGGNGNAATRIITFAANSSSPHTLKLDNASYINIYNLTIIGSGTTNGWPLHLQNTNYVNVKRCVITFTGNGLTSSSQNYTAVVANGGAASISTQGIVSYLTLEDNTISGGYAGIYIYGNSNTTSSYHYLTGNNISNCSNYGVYEYYVYTDMDIRNNTIAMRTANTSGYGIYVFAPQSISSPIDITGNIIKDAGQYGISLSNCFASAATPINIANNMIGGGFNSSSPFGIYITSGSFVNIWFNSINLDMASVTTSNAAVYLSSVTNLDIRNNNFAVTGTNSTALAFYSGSCTFLNLNYNNYYRYVNPTQLININGALYSSTNLVGGSGYNANSRSTNPMYTNAKDLHTGLKCNTGIDISGYGTDIEGNTRSNPPGIGADENTNSSTTDLAVESISSPSVPVASGSQNITVLIRNNGSSTITSANVSYKVNNGAAVTQAWTGSLAPCATAVVTFTGSNQFNFLPSTAYTLLAYSDQPNGSSDNATANDTARLTVVATGMSGNFTIDGSIAASATNFQTFATAITAMTTNGISGPVNFTVAPATYSVQVVIPAIAGASSTNTVTFDGGAGNASTVILSFSSSTSSSRHTLRFDGTNWIRIRNMSIVGSGTFAWPVHINTGSSNLQIRNCLISCTQTLTNQTSTNYAGIVISAATTSLSSTNLSSNIDIDSNTITNGWYGISFYGSGSTGANPGINIRKNKIDSAGLYGINLSYAMGSVMNDNAISMRISNGASTGSYGINILNCYTTATENIQVNRNKITGCTQYGIYLQSAGGVSASTLRAQLINNAIGGGFTSTSASGIYFTSATYWDVWFNSVNLDNAATGTAQCIYLTSGSATFNDIRNNNFAVTNTSASGALCYRSVSGATVNALNYNNYYKAGATASTNIISVLGTNYTPSTFTGANGGGANSLAQNSSFTSSTNLLPTVNTNKGTALANVPTDIAGTYRNIPPDLGSYEIPSTALTDLAIMKLNSPDTTLPAGSYNVSVTVRNFGSTPITSFNLRHTVNGTNLQDTAITGISLAQNTAMDINMGAGKQATFGVSANTLKVYLHQPNGNVDGLQTNDSIVIGPRFPAMSGVYTINPAGSGPSNFVSFTAAATAINSGGVNGPVVFNVASGTFTEQIVLNALSGASATNTIRFVGNGIANTTLNFAGAAAPNQHTVRLNGSSWISFENMTISGGGTTSNWVVHLLNASNCTIKKCKISVPGSVTTNAFINILANNATTTNGETTTSTLINNNVIDSNTIENGYYGIMLSNSNGSNINYMRGNAMNNCYYNGVYFYFQQAFKFNGNTIAMRAGISNSYGINSFIGSANSPLYNEIRNNTITNAGSYGIYMTSASGSSSGTIYGEVVNNMIGGGFFNTTGAGIYLSSCSYWKIWHNSVNYDAVGNSAALNIQNGSFNDVRNNIFAIRNASATLAMPAIISTSTAASVFNYNNFYNASTTNLVNIAGNVYNTGSYTGAFPNGAGLNSKNLNPNFTSATNLHIGEACMNGDNLGITADIDGNARGTTPDMGADEMTTVPALDASVAKVNSPGFPFVAGTQPVNITIQNNGNTTLTGLTLAYSVNGSVPTTQSWSGSLASCDTLNFTFSTLYNFTSGPNVVKVYVASPNGGTDANTLNDTISTVPFCTGLSGTYTINPAGAGATNFTSFSSALSALNCGGLAGAVVFNVANGVYNEQVNIGSIQGASASNTITIQSASGNASAVTVSYVPGAENYVLNLNSTDYLTVKNITLLNASTSGSYFNVLQVGNSANNNTFRGCVFTNSLPTNGSLVYSNNTTDHNNTFVGNTFNGGSYGIQWQSNTSSPAAYAANLVIDSNTFTNQYNYGMYVYYCNGTKIRNNNITSASTTTYYGISTLYNYQNAQILNNNVVVNTAASTAYGISLVGLNNGGNASVRALVANNMVKVSTGTANNFGIFIDQYMYFTDILHNTVNALTTGAGVSYAISINTGTPGYTADNCNFVNNIFQVLSSSTSSAAFYHNSSSVSNVIINYNNYFISTGNIARFQSTTQATLAAWKTAYATYNVNSLSKRVSFAGANDLHNTTPCLDNAGSNAYLSLVDRDIDGQSRHASTPDIGADEFTAQPYDVRVSRISAPAGYSASAQTVKAWIVNNGTTTVTSANVGYNINGGAAVSQNFTGLSLAACDSIEVTFTTQVSTPTGYSVLQAFVSGNINGSSPDGNNLNDTTGFAFCTSLAGNFTINSALSLSSTNFQSISGAVSAMKSCGLSGAVTFTIAPGTYTEQVTISNIPGVSATNTITFDGVDSSNRIVQYNLAGNTNRYVIMIDSCRYVTIKNLKIVNNSTTYGWGILVRGTTAANNSDFVTIRKCAFVLPLTTTNSYAAIVLANSFTGATTGTNYAQNITIDSNTFTGSYYGISINGVSTSVRSFANAINDNVFYNTYYQAVYAQYLSDLKVNRNSMYNIGRSSSISPFSTPVYLIYVDSFEVIRNKMYGIPGGYGIYAQNCTGVSGSPNIIANNMIQVGEGTNNGQVVYLTSSPFTSVYYNSLYSTTTATSTSNCALYAQSSNNLVVVNNNLSSLYNTGNYVVYYPSTTVTQSDYNNYFGGTYYNGQGSVTALKNTLYAGNDANSKSISPGYVSINDLHTPTNTLLDSAGLAITAITDDIDGQTRSTIKPDIGADEFSAPTENTGIIAIINPSNPITAGANEVHVIIRNFGASVLTFDSVIYQVGSTTHRRLWTGSLATNAVDTVRFTATSGPGSSDQRYTFPSGSSAIKAWTAYPNGVADVSNNDDTLTSVVCTGYAGTYTINPAGSGPTNFASFTAAANALQCGITAPVTFNVAAGTYNEQFVINPIPGSSSTNTVLFKPANGIASSVIVQSNSSASNNYVVKLAGADYVTLDKLTLNATNTNYGIVIDIVNYNVTDKPGYINITNCSINGAVQSTAAALTLINALVETPNLVISGNTFTRGSYAVNIAGANAYPYTAGIQVTNNIFGSSSTDAPFYYGIYATYGRHIVITGNQFTGPNYTGYGAISLQNSSGKVKINNNKINAAGGGNGITATFVNYNFETDSGEIINNSIAIGGTSTSTGIYLQYSANFNIYHNSVNNYSTSASSYAFRTYSAGTNYRKNRLLNNLLINTAGFALYIEGNNTANAIAVLETSNYNNFYTAGTNLAFITTTGNISNLTAFKNVLYSGNDSSSVSGDPVFTSSSNLVPTSCKPNAVGIPLTGITTDINNVTRKALPDMGAFEFTPALAPPTVSSPVNLCYGSTAAALTATSANTKLWFTTATGGIGSTSASIPNTGTRVTQTYYVADSSATSGCISNRAAITVNIDTAVSNNTVSSPQTLCSGSTPAALTGGTPAGGNGTFTYTWLSSTTSASTGFAAASGTNNASGYTPAALTATTWYKRVVTSGACGRDSSLAVEITVTAPVANNSINSSPQTICSGSTPSALTASTPTGGDGSNYTYSWLSSTTSATTGFAVASGTNNTSGYTPAALSASTWYRRVVTSGTCNKDTTAAVKVTVTNAIASNTITSSPQTICSGSTPTAITGSTPTGGDGTTYTYSWLSSTTSATAGFAVASGTNNTSGYSPAALSANTWYRRVVSSGVCASDTAAAIKITITNAIAANTVTSSPQTICSGSTPTAITGSTPTGGDGTTYTYSWLSSTTSATAGFAVASGTNNTSGYTPAALTANTWYKRVVTSGACAKDTTAAIAITVNAGGTWTGASSNAWGNIANWSCPQIPTSSTNVTIPAGTPNNPVVTDAQQANNITINTGATLTLNNANSVLNIFGSITNNGTFVNTNGKLSMSGSSAQTLQAGTYNKVQINNSNGVALGGSVTLNDSLILTSGVLSLNNNNLTLGTTSYASAGGVSSYVKTNGSGQLVINNVGTSGKTGNVSIPVGNSTYNPVVLNNTGTADNYTVWVVDSVTNSYSGSTPSGAKLTTNAVNRTWFINEAVAGGSNASVTLQWNAADELASFTRGSSYVSRYTGTVWNSTTASAAAGSNPYTQIRTGITSFSPFGVGSNGVLPVEMLTFTGSKQHNNVLLNWSTASEKNNKGFDVERSADGKTWSKIEFVKGNGNSSMVSNYSYTDVNAFGNENVLFYRLKQVDMNGAYAYTNSIVVENKVIARITATVQPNPFNSNLRLNISSPVSNDATVTVTDMAGKIIAIQNHSCNEGDNAINVNGVETLKAGIYFVTIKIGNETITHKVVKQ